MCEDAMIRCDVQRYSDDANLFKDQWPVFDLFQVLFMHDAYPTVVFQAWCMRVCMVCFVSQTANI